MNKRVLKIILIWNAVLTALLIGSLLMNANFALAANDPPVQVFTAHADHAGGENGGGTVTNFNIYSNTVWSQLLTVNVDFKTQTHNHQCVAIASADVINPYTGNPHNAYRFDIALDSGTTGDDTISGRTLDFVNSTTGSSVQTVTTNRAFFEIPNGVHTVYFLAKKFTGSPTAVVSDSSMSVICMKVHQ